MITRLVIEHFKSIERLDLELGPLTVFVGPNGCGKSNIVDALRFVRDALRFGLDRAVADRHGIDSIRQWSARGARNVTITVHASVGDSSGRYSFTLGSREKLYTIRREIARWEIFEPTSDAPDDEEFEKEEEFERAAYSLERGTGENANVIRNGSLFRPINKVDPDELALHGMAMEFYGLRRTVSDFEAFSIFPNTLRKPQESSNYGTMSATGDNLTSVFKAMQKGRRGGRAKQEIVDTLRRVMPALDTITIRPLGGFLMPMFRVREADGKAHEFNVSQISDGTLRVLGLLTALYQPNRPAVIALEEPEQTVNPAVMGVIAEAIKEVSRSCQVIVTTHSPEFVDFFDPDHIRAVEMVDGVTRVGPISAHQKEAVKQRLFSLGELMTKEGLYSDEAAGA